MRDRRPLSGIFVAGLFVVALAGVAAAQEKSLHWRALDVRARLDADGRLRIAERQAIVFTGDWNGGERVFRIFPGQSLDFEKLTRIDPATGREQPLSPGDLSEVDQYSFPDPKTLRWRSRLPSDPPFDRTEIVYELTYTLSGIVRREGDVYRLEPDFVFPSRSGAIEAFTLDLELDPAWRPLGPFSARITRHGLVPGESVVVPLRLAYQGAGRPAAVATPLPRAVGLAFAVALLVAVALLFLLFLRREKALGRLAPLTPPEAIDEAWLQEHLFSLKPEEAGGLWDETVGPPEVAAVLARLTAEKKIETWASDKTLHMRLLVPMAELPGYEKDLLSALFFGGRKETDTDAIRDHYKNKGFDPASKIRPELERRLAKIGYGEQAPAPSRLPTLALVGSGVLLLAVFAFLRREQIGLVVGVLILHAVLYGIGVSQAYLVRKKTENVLLQTLRFLFVPAIFIVLAFRGADEPRPRAELALLAGLLLLRVGITNSLFNMAKTRNGPMRIARRKALASARAFFDRELQKPSPRLSDDWMPYLVALGLQKDMDRWFRAYGGEREALSIGSAAGSSSSSGSSPAPASGAWSGGGGHSGGAGASASWAAAAGALAAGVSAPSSGSGGGGGGGGGGGSSGGGGGGGW
jgi:uncharacterized membrane protein YgcG